MTPQRRSAFRLKLRMAMHDQAYSNTETNSKPKLIEQDIDLSSTGLCFRSQHHYLIGDKIKLHLELAEHKHIQLMAQVQWTKNKPCENIIGAQFLFRCQAEQDSIAQYLFTAHQEHFKQQH